MPKLTIEKLNIIVHKLNEIPDEYTIFLETGTLVGETTLNVQPYFEQVYTIELSEGYYNYFNDVKIQNNYDNIFNYFGDSSVVIPNIIESLEKKDRVVFWLDGHWSSGDTAKGEKDCPLIEECKSIDLLYKSDKGIILIDDYRLFGTNIDQDWSSITTENILKCFNNFNIIQNFVYDDVLILLIENQNTQSPILK
jgi:hypothetical protein